MNDFSRRSPSSDLFVDSDPYPWPFDGDLTAANTALIVIDMQTDFCGIGGLIHQMGYDPAPTRSPSQPVRPALPANPPPRFHRPPPPPGPPPHPLDLPPNENF